MEAYEAKLRELERLFSDMDGGLKPTNSAEMEAAIRATEEVVKSMQDTTNQLNEMEEGLKARLASISRSQLTEGQDIQNLATAAEDIRRQQREYEAKAATIQTLTDEMRRKLEAAKTSLRSAEFPAGDAPLGSGGLSTLVQAAMSLADKHQSTAGTVDRTANIALSDSEKSLALVRTLMNKENKVKELIGDLKTTYDQISAQVKGLENQATRLSGEARDESRMAEGMLKDIANMERDVPSTMKTEMNDMVTRLDGLRETVEQSIPEYEALQDNVQRDKTTAEDLLAKGKAAKQDFDRLLHRANVAKADTEGALQRINGNMGDVDNALKTLREFDKDIADSKAKADAAIKRLPGINTTIQQAVQNNRKTTSILENVSDDYNGALGTINVLENAVNGLEGKFNSLPSYTNIVRDATNLNEGATGLRTIAGATAVDVMAELDKAKRQEAEAGQAAAGASEAFNNAKQTRDAVGKTLRDVSNLLALMNQPGVVDETRLRQLEVSLADAQRNVDGVLKPRLRDMEEHEAAQRRRLSGINLDIDTILADIANLEDILKTIPKGCYNSPPIEEP